nr:unnamed protein product [Digitaria exilis]
MGRSPCCEKAHTNKGAWSLIAGQLPGRTDNEIKNYWNTHIKRKLLSRGIDPQTHRPLSGGSAAAASGLTSSSTAGFPSQSPAAPRPARPAIVIPPNVMFASAPAPAEDRHSSSGGGSTDAPRCPDLNLDLSVGPPPPSCSPPKTPGSAAASTPTSQQQQQRTATICLCYHLGVRSGEACSCKQTASPAAAAGFRFLRPLEEGQYI